MITSTMSYVLNLHVGDTASIKVSAPVTANALPIARRDAPLAAVMQFKRGDTNPGLYLRSGLSWQKVLPYEVLNGALLAPVTIDVYFELESALPVAEGSTVFLNGGLCDKTEIPADDKNFWTVVTPVTNSTPGPDPVASKQSYQSFVQLMRGSGFSGVMAQWVMTDDFRIENFDNSRILLSAALHEGEYTVGFSLQHNGEAFATLNFNGETQVFEVASFTPTTLAKGDVLAFSQDEGFMTMPPLTILVSN